MRKSIIAISALAIVSLASCGSKGDISKQWEVVFDRSSMDSMYQAQLASIDTITSFPPDFLMMKAELSKMSADSVASTVPAEVVEMLKIEDIATFKAKVKESLEKSKLEQDSIDASRAIVYDFQKGGMLKIYPTDQPENVDTSMTYRADLKSKKVYINGNKNIVAADMAKDTVTFDILHLSADSLSLKLVSNEKDVPQTSIKPMGFRVHKAKAKK